MVLLWGVAGLFQLSLTFQHWVNVNLGDGEWVQAGVFRGERGGGRLPGTIVGDSEVLLCPSAAACRNGLRTGLISCKAITLFSLFALMLFFHSVSVQKPLYTLVALVISCTLSLANAIVWHSSVTGNIPQAFNHTQHNPSTVSDGWSFSIYNAGVFVQWLSLLLYAVCLLCWVRDPYIRIPPLFSKHTAPQHQLEADMCASLRLLQTGEEEEEEEGHEMSEVASDGEQRAI